MKKYTVENPPYPPMPGFHWASSDSSSEDYLYHVRCGGDAAYSLKGPASRVEGVFYYYVEESVGEYFYNHPIRYTRTEFRLLPQVIDYHIEMGFYTKVP